MQQFNKWKNTKGFVMAADRGLRFRYMITEEAKREAAILTFWHKHGLDATKEAFGVSRPTLYRWQAKLKQGQGRLEALNKQSRAPKQKRRRVIPRRSSSSSLTKESTTSISPKTN